VAQNGKLTRPEDGHISPALLKTRSISSSAEYTGEHPYFDESKFKVARIFRVL